MKKIFSKRHIIKGFLLLLLLAACAAFITSPLLAISRIAVQGNVILSKEQICTIANINEPVNIFTVRTDYLQNRLEHDLRIEKAKVRRVFPNTLLIEIEERRTLATLHCDYGYVDIASNGTIMDAYRNLRPVKLPMITGIYMNNVYIGDMINDADVLKVLEYLSNMDNTALIQIAEINLAFPQNITAFTTTGIKIKLGDLTAADDKAKKTMDFLRDSKTMKKPVEYIDFAHVSPVLKFKS